MATSITEDYVSFEIAKLLKEKGFDSGEVGDHGGYYSERCYESGHGVKTKSGQEVGIVYDDLTNSELDYDEYLRPTLQMAMKWLRTKNIFIDIFHYNSKIAPFVWVIFAYNVLTPQRVDTYEEAEEAAIKYVLENWDDVNKVLDEYYKNDNLLPKI